MARLMFDASLDKEYIFEVAKHLGWLENKVQIKKFDGMEGTWYFIEPYEEDCNCPDLIRPPVNAQQASKL